MTRWEISRSDSLQAVKYLLAVGICAVVFVAPGVWGFLRYGQLFSSQALPYFALNLAAAAVFTPVVFVLNQRCSRCATALLAIIVASTLAIGLIEVELYSRFGFSFSPRFFANVSGEATKIAANELSSGLVWATFTVLGVALAMCGLLRRPALWPAMKWSSAALPTAIALLSLLVLVDKWNAHSERVFPLVRFVSEARSYYFSPHREIELEWSSNEHLVAESLGMLFVDPVVSPTAAVNERPNLIVVFLEGFNAEYVQPGLDGFPGLTPNLNRIARRSAVVPAFYGSVDDTLNAIISGLCGVMTGYADSDWKEGKVLGLGSDVPCVSDILHDQGYLTAFLWGDSREYSGMGQLMSQHGIDVFYDKRDIRAMKKDTLSSSHGNVYDEDLIAFAIDFIEDRETTRPYNLTIVTYDTHFQFEVSPNCPDYSWQESAKSWDENTQAKFIGRNDWVRAVHCTDAAIGKLWEYLEKSGELDSTAFVVVGDHMNWRDIQRHGKVFFAAHSPIKTLSEDVAAAGHTPDLAPTVLELVGISIDPFHFGRSLFGSRKQYQHLVSPNFDVLDGSMSSITASGTSESRIVCGERELMQTNLQNPERHLSPCERTKLISQQWGALRSQ